MKLQYIEIKNLKSVTTASLTFPVKEDFQVALLFGDNGAGKTTVLEAISLLGHVSTMRRICTHGIGTAPDTVQSSFRAFKTDPKNGPGLREATHEQYKDAGFSEDCGLIRECGIDLWWNRTTISGSTHRPARIKYRVFFNNDTLEFFISFLQNHDLSITEALSRDQGGPGEKIHDGNMDNWFAIIYRQEAREQVEAFIEHMRLVSPHSYWSSTPERYRTDSRTLRRPESHSVVAYWNTDLNDFGRKNDLRESVKKIRIDFVSQMIDRLGITLRDGSGARNYHELTTATKVQEDKLGSLNESLRRALVDHALAMGRDRDGRTEGLIRITEIDATGGPRSPAVLMARRLGDAADIAIDHLSAGENESVFIFLLIHGMPCENSIILLDEPDLHLSDFAKSRFYEELYRVARSCKCQIVISTHSAFARSKGDSLTQFFIRPKRRVSEHGAPSLVYKTAWDEDFGELLTFHYARCATHAMSQAGIAWKILSLPLRLSLKLGEFGLEFWVGATICLAVLGFYSLGATLNDIFLIFAPNPARHKLIIYFLLTSSAVLLVVLLALRVIRSASSEEEDP